MKDRRQFLKTLAIGTATLGLTKPSLAFQDNKTLNDLKFAFKTPPYLQNNAEGKATIIALTNKPAIAWVEIIDNSAQTPTQVFESNDGMINANDTLFKFRLTETSPKSSISYKVKAKEVIKFEPYSIEYGLEISSEEFEFNFLNEDQTDVSCVIYNDVHENTDTYGDMLHYVDEQFDFAVCNGDSFHYVTDEDNLTDKMLNTVVPLFASQKMLVMNRGNHETRGSFARHFKRYFDYKDNKFYQAFKLGPIYWVFLDGGEDKPDSHEVYAGTVDYDHYRKEQAQWLDKLVKSKEFQRSPFRIVINHIPAFHSDDWHGTLHNREVFHPILEHAYISAVISGHTHRYGFYDRSDEHNYPIFIGGGPKEGQRTIIDIRANETELNIKMIKDDGKIIHQLTEKA